MKINCVIVDDDISSQKKISEAIARLSIQGDLDFQCTYFSDPLNSEILEHYDLYILDIDMPGINGFDLAETIYDRYPEAIIMFCTCHEDFVFGSYKANAFYFIRKDHLLDELTYALRKFVQRFINNKKTYLIHSNKDMIPVSYARIVFFEKYRESLTVHTVDTEIKDIDKSLDELLSEVSDERFVKINRNTIINLRYVSKLSGDKVILSTGAEFSIPRRNTAEVTIKYLNYLKR
ncbi:MAG: response regulator transcription factor [Erysipelotrichaceae bacterium]|nr:response regulator transcription factor [Bacillus sp. (in: firmicutes)]MBR3350802.1 response regulator transcription factor [Erysipelotrichaceae bacterium]